MLLVRLLLHGSVPSAASLPMWEVTFHGLSTKAPTWALFEGLMETRNDKKATDRFNCTVLPAQRTREPSSLETRTPLDDTRKKNRAHLEAHPPITKAEMKLLALCQAAPGTCDYQEITNVLTDVAAEEACDEEKHHVFLFIRSET
ncbi:Hypothetical protein, putative [Bodo saltans]|uniref:Uncharacterized protein n=1 Tax=Bodo saltans TaxID=75058 RepID=A0A0S4J0I2_BODSA|nr:Hypothetical protein, putative [Bodo saltans]|eukprot:CUG76964.1 Hypothetical protein, putative [Bodo saltans]